MARGRVCVLIAAPSLFQAIIFLPINTLALLRPTPLLLLSDIRLPPRPSCHPPLPPSLISLCAKVLPPAQAISLLITNCQVPRPLRFLSLLIPNGLLHPTYMF